MLEEHSEDYRNVDEDRELSDAWTNHWMDVHGPVRD